jgi:hypothetical protein
MAERTSSAALWLNRSAVLSLLHRIGREQSRTGMGHDLPARQDRMRVSSTPNNCRSHCSATNFRVVPKAVDSLRALITNFSLPLGKNAEVVGDARTWASDTNASAASVVGKMSQRV